MENLDKLTVRGLGLLDGEYPCDLLGMTLAGHADEMTNREGRRVKEISDVRAGEVLREFLRGDSDVRMALAVVIVERAGKTVDLDALLDAPIGSGISFDLGDREPAKKDPPVPLSNEPSGERQPDSRNGGGSSTGDSDPPENDPNPIGLPGSERSWGSAPLTSAI